MARSTLKPAHVAQYLGRKSSNRIANARMRSTLCLGTHSIRRMYSLLQRLRSLRHGFWYGVSERIHWSRGAFEETPARELCSVDREQGERIAALRSRYQVQFELRFSAATSTRNYEYLDLLDRGWANLGRPRPKGGALCDVGCASFWYADALQTFFRPDSIVGVEVEGHRLFRDGRARIDYARGYGPPAECALCRRGLCRVSRTGGHHYGLVPVLDAGLHIGVAVAAVAPEAGEALPTNST